jgi:CPA2 family monovalent cation:H+ antiporter-2
MALLSGGVRTADVTAIDYCLFLTVEQQDVRAFVSRHPDLRAKFDRIAVQRAAMNTCELAMGEAPA